MISDLYDALIDVFKVYGCPAKIFLGEQFRAMHTEPFRVVLWQGKDSPADTFGGALPASVPAANRTQAIDPRPVATRLCGFSVELWAVAPQQRNAEDQYRANLAYLDALVNQFACAMQEISSGIFDLQGGRHAAGNGDVSVLGLGYTLLAVCAVPVVITKWPTQQLSECSKTWRHATATAAVVVQTEVKPDPPTFVSGPEFTVPTVP